MTGPPSVRWALLGLFCALVVGLGVRPVAAQDQAAAWALLRQLEHAVFMRHSEAPGFVLTSPWCRCKETARLAIGQEPEIFLPLSNLIGRQQHAVEQVAALKAYLATLDGNTRVLFVTHGVVINALTGISPASGEMVIVKLGPSGDVVVAGRLLVD